MNLNPDNIKLMQTEKDNILQGLNSLVLHGVILTFSEQIKSFRVLMDPTLLFENKFEKKVSMVARSTFY